MLVVKYFSSSRYRYLQHVLVLIDYLRDTRPSTQYLEMFPLPILVIVNLFFHDVIYVCNLHYLLELASPRNNDSKIIPY